MRRVDGAAWLLFERLVDREPTDAGGGRRGWVHDLDGLRDSIAGQLRALFNTRAPLDIAALETRQRSTIDYGIPDLSAFPRGNFEAMTQLGRHVEAAIRIYEPRLLGPRVVIQPIDRADGALTVVVRGHVQTSAMTNPVWFDMAWRSEPSDVTDD